MLLSASCEVQMPTCRHQALVISSRCKLRVNIFRKAFDEVEDVEAALDGVHITFHVGA